MSKRVNVGGQAVIEGVMMRGPKRTAIAVRKPDGEIDIKVNEGAPFTNRKGFFSIPFIRGAASLIDSLIIGMNSLSYSASFFEEMESESKFDAFLKRKLGDKLEKVVMALSIVLALAIAIPVFFIMPTLVAGFTKKLLSPILVNLLEGLIRILIFLLYIVLISRVEDIKRVFQYHGAEHKSIHCYESGLLLTVENARGFSTLHPRCGTNFLFIVMIVSILVFGFFGWPNIALRIVLRILLLPVVAGISYEIIKWLGKSESNFSKIIAYPGLMLQKLTTREPDDSQLEVAIASLKSVLDEYNITDGEASLNQPIGEENENI